MRGEYVRGAARLCAETGTLLVIDEVVTGFRVAPGGIQAVHGVRPDLSIFGKIMAGGVPGGAGGGGGGGRVLPTPAPPRPPPPHRPPPHAPPRPRNHHPPPTPPGSATLPRVRQRGPRA